MNQFIITGDWHLREQVPTCRKNQNECDWMTTQREKIMRMASFFSGEYMVIHTGDLFHRARSSNKTILSALHFLDLFGKTKVINIPGNHDLIGNNLSDISGTSWEIIKAAGSICVPIKRKQVKRGVCFILDEPINCAIYHGYVHNAEKEINPLIEGYTAEELCDELRQADFIFTGDNHQAFSYQSKRGQLLINPGHITRQSANEFDQEPGFYALVLDKNDSKKYISRFVSFDVSPEDISRDHLEKIEIRDSRIESFVSTLSGSMELSMSFESNLKKYIQENSIRKGVADVVWDCFKGGQDGGHG